MTLTCIGAPAAAITNISVTPNDPTANASGTLNYSAAITGTSATPAKCIRARFTGDATTTAAPSSAAWEYLGSATTDGSKITLTPLAQTQVGVAVYQAPVPSEGLHITFDVYMGGGDEADGSTFTFLDPAQYTHTTGGIGGDMGYGDGLHGPAFVMDTYDNFSAQPSDNYVALVNSGADRTFDYIQYNTSVPSLRTTHAYDITVSGGVVTVKMDGTQVLSASVAMTPTILPAFTAATGGSTDEHSVSNVQISYTGGGPSGTSIALPPGMTIGTPTLAGSTALTPASWSGTTTVDSVTFTNATGQTLSNGTLNFGGITHNRAKAGTYYLQLTTFSDTGCTTQTETTSAAFAITDNVTVSIVVDASFTFLVAGRPTTDGACNGVTPTAGVSTTSSAVSIGSINAGARNGAQKLQVSSNAASGFIVYAKNTGALTISGHVFSDVSGTNAIPAAFPAIGTEAFGYTTDGVTAFATNKWAAMTGTNASVITNNSGPASSNNCVMFQAQATAVTPAGSYSTTVVYTAVPAF